jgi:hypothetical protein
MHYWSFWLCFYIAFCFNLVVLLLFLFMALGEQIGVRDTFLALDRAFDDLMIEIGI